jgi:hypothetical protein
VYLLRLVDLFYCWCWQCVLFINCNNEVDLCCDESMLSDKLGELCVLFIADMELISYIRDLDVRICVC